MRVISNNDDRVAGCGQRFELLVHLRCLLTELIIMLLYINTKSVTETFIIVLAVPFSAVGAICLLYLNIAYESAKGEGRMRTLAEL